MAESTVFFAFTAFVIFFEEFGLFLELVFFVDAVRTFGAVPLAVVPLFAEL